ncbi:MAG: hypothetical protein V4568_02660 [Pseudomonadota bacterium]
MPNWLKSLTQYPSESSRLRRQGVGVGLFIGFFVAIAGYIFTDSGWWFLAPFIGFAVAWRIVLGRWPFSAIKNQ